MPCFSLASFQKMKFVKIPKIQGFHAELISLLRLHEIQVMLPHFEALEKLLRKKLPHEKFHRLSENLPHEKLHLISKKLPHEALRKFLRKKLPHEKLHRMLEKIFLNLLGCHARVRRVFQLPPKDNPRFLGQLVTRLLPMRRRLPGLLRRRVPLHKCRGFAAYRMAVSGEDMPTELFAHKLLNPVLIQMTMQKSKMTIQKSRKPLILLEMLRVQHNTRIPARGGPPHPGPPQRPRLGNGATLDAPDAVTGPAATAVHGLPASS